MNVPFDDSLRIEITFKAEHLGVFEDRLEIVFEDVQLHTEFVIVRTLSASVGDRATFDALKPVAPYTPRKRVDRAPETEVVEGPQPELLDAIKYIGKLPAAAIPPRLHEVLATGKVDRIIQQLRASFLPTVFDSAGYSKHFKHLLWAEEYKSE